MSSSAPEPATAPADPLDGRYRLGESLGSGGTGSVRRARDELLDRPVAVKLLHAGYADDAGQRARLRDEARLAGALQHPGIARIFDYGEAGEPARQPYIVMELVEGTPLSALLRERGALSAAETLDVVGQVAVALQVAHAAGIVHRDLKPGNVMVTDGGRMVLVDFGIARSTVGEDLTASGTVVGTAAYLSPEQARGLPAEPRSDLYALGMVAYECLTSLRPFHRDSQVATALAHLHEDAPPLPDAVPPRLARLVHAMLAKRPDDRPGDAAAVVRGVGACAEDPMPAVETAAAGAGLARAVSGPTRPRPPLRARLAAGGVGGRTRWAAAVLAASLVVLVPATQLVGTDGDTVPEASAGDPAETAPGDRRVSVVLVPRERLLGRTAAEAEAILARRGLDAEREPADPEEGPAGAEPGTVVEVVPATRVTAGGSVTLLLAP